jgi:hypothetical protein
MFPFWFSLSAPTWWLPWGARRIPVKLWTCFRRAPMNVWGIGILFVGNHHLMYVGDAGLTIVWHRVFSARKTLVR